MKEIKAYLRKYMVEPVIDAIKALNDPPGPASDSTLTRIIKLVGEAAS